MALERWLRKPVQRRPLLWVAWAATLVAAVSHAADGAVVSVALTHGQTQSWLPTWFYGHVIILLLASWAMGNGVFLLWYSYLAPGADLIDLLLNTVSVAAAQGPVAGTLDMKTKKHKIFAIGHMVYAFTMDVIVISDLGSNLLPKLLIR